MVCLCCCFVFCFVVFCFVFFLFGFGDVGVFAYSLTHLSFTHSKVTIRWFEPTVEIELPHHTKEPMAAIAQALGTVRGGRTPELRMEITRQKRSGAGECVFLCLR